MATSGRTSRTLAEVPRTCTRASVPPSRSGKLATTTTSAATAATPPQRAPPLPPPAPPPPPALARHRGHPTRARDPRRVLDHAHVLHGQDALQLGVGAR